MNIYIHELGSIDSCKKILVTNQHLIGFPFLSELIIDDEY